MVASLLPKDVNLNVNNLDTDEQLLARLRRLTEEVAPLLAQAAEHREDEIEPAASGIEQISVPPTTPNPPDTPLSARGPI